MTPKTWLLLIVALVCGVATSFCVKSIFFVDTSAQTSTDSSAEAGPKERILIANADLPSGTELTAQNVRLNLIPESSIPRDALFSFDGLAGRKTLRDVKAGSAISLYDLELEEEAAIPEKPFVPPGYSVVPIEIQTAANAKGGRNLLKTTSLAQMIKIGDVVALAVVKEESVAASSDALAPRRPRLTTKRIVEGVSVFGVADEKRFAAESDGATRVSIVSVLLSAEQLEIVRKASDEGKIKVLATGEGEDETFDENNSLNLTSIFSAENAVSPTDSNVDSDVKNVATDAAEPAFEIPMNDDFTSPELVDVSENESSEFVDAENKSNVDESEVAVDEQDDATSQAKLESTAARRATDDDRNGGANLDANFSSNETPILPSLEPLDEAPTSLVEKDVSPSPTVEKSAAASNENARIDVFRTRRPNVSVAEETVVPVPSETLKVLGQRAKDETPKTLKTVGDVRWRKAVSGEKSNAAESSESSRKKNAVETDATFNRTRRG